MKYTMTDLERMTQKELWALLRDTYHMKGLSKERKVVLIRTVLKVQDSTISRSEPADQTPAKKMAKYSRESLMDNHTQKELWAIAKDEFGVVGMSKAKKEDLVTTILAYQENATNDNVDKGQVIYVRFDSNQFPVQMCGETIASIITKVKARANAHDSAKYRVNKTIVPSNYIMKPGETLIIVNPVKTKG